MSDAHYVDVKIRATDENTQPVMSGIVDQMNKTADALTRSMRGVTAEFDKLKGGMEQLNRHSETHVGKGVTESFGKAQSAVLAFASGLTGVGLGLGLTELARKAGEFTRESISLFATLEDAQVRARLALGQTKQETEEMTAVTAKLKAETGIASNENIERYVKFSAVTARTKAENLALFNMIAEYSRTSGTSIDNALKIGTLAINGMKDPLKELQHLLNGLAANLPELGDDFERYIARVNPQLQQFGLNNARMMEAQVANFAALEKMYGPDKLGLMRAATGQIDIIQQAMDPSSFLGMRARPELIKMMREGREKEMQPFITKMLAGEGAFEKEEGTDTFTYRAIMVQRMYNIQAQAKDLEQQLKTQQDYTKNLQTITDAQKGAGKVAEDSYELDKTTLAKKRKFDAEFGDKVREAWGSAASGLIYAPKGVEPGASPYEAHEQHQRYMRQHPYAPWLRHLDPENAPQPGGAGPRAEPPPTQSGAFNRFLHRIIPSRQEGGPIPETGPYMLHEGEHVLKAGERQPGGEFPGDDRIETWPTDQQFLDTYSLLSSRPAAWITLLQKGGKMASAAMDIATRARRLSQADKNAPPTYVFDKLLHNFHIPGYQEGGTVGGEPGQPSLIVAHGGETVAPEHKTDDNTEATKENTEAIKELLLEMRRGGIGALPGGRPWAYTPGAGEAGVPPVAGAIGGPYGGGGGAGGGAGGGLGGGGAYPGVGGVPPIVGAGHPGSAPGSYPGAPGIGPALPGQEGVGLTGVGGYNFMGSAAARALGMNVTPGSMQDMVKRQTAVGTITANKYAADDIAGFLNDLHSAGAPLGAYAGVFANRQKRGGGGWSQHAYGNAVDIETGLGSGPDNSPALFAWAQAHPKEFAEIQAKHHMRNLDTSSGARMHDWGHFEWTPAGRDKTINVADSAETGHLGDSSGHSLGSNLANLATENASGRWGASRMSGSFMRQVAEGNRELYGIPVGAGARGAERYPAWAKAKMAEIARTGGIDRTRFAAELQNPELLERVLGIGAGENVESAQKLYELMMNRADLMGQTLAHEATPRAIYGNRGYYAGYKPGEARNPAIRAKLLAALQAAIGVAHQGGVKQGEAADKQINQAYMTGVGSTGGNVAGINADRVFAEGFIAAGGDPSHLPPGLRSAAGGGVAATPPPPPTEAAGPHLPTMRPGAAKVGQPFMPDMGPAPTGGDITTSGLPDLPPEWSEAHPELAGANRAAEAEMRNLDAGSRRRMAAYQRAERERAQHEANIRRAESLTPEELEYDRTHFASMDARSRAKARANLIRSRSHGQISPGGVPLPRARPSRFGPSAHTEPGGARTISSHPIAGATPADPGGEIQLAGGAFVDEPTRALIGEAGPEVVLPLGGGGGGFDLAKLRSDYDNLRAHMQRPIRMTVESPRLRPSDSVRRQTARALRDRDKDYHDRRDTHPKLADIAI